MQSASRARHFRWPDLPLHAHPADPAIVHQLAKKLGQSVADAQSGLADRLIAELINALIEAAKARGYSGNISGLRTRLWWTVRDAAAQRERSRQQNDRQVRRAAIEAIVAGMPYPSVLHAAKQANRAAELPMAETAVLHIVATEIAIEARRRECNCCIYQRIYRE